MGLPFPSTPSFDTFTFPNVFLKVTVVNFVVPGVIFDFASFSFHVPICGSAAKHAAHPKKQNARINPIPFVFMTAIESGFSLLVNTFPDQFRSVVSTENDQIAVKGPAN
jgi:hypothetical protein